MKRIVSVWLKNFSLDRLRWQAQQSALHTPAAHNGALHPVDREPFALVTRDANGLRISSRNDAARQAGIHEGMRLSDARALLPSLVTQPTNPEADALALHKLADWCQRYTPVVGIDGANGLWLDITGAAHLCGGEGNLLADLRERLTAIGFTHGLGLARTPGAAWAIARFSNPAESNTQSIAASSLKHTLHPLSLAALRLDDKSLYLLRRFGLGSIGALCDIPRSSLKCRFPSKEVCEAVLHRFDQALDCVAEPIVPLRTTPVYCERASFAEPILVTENFHLGLYELLSHLVQRMERDRKGATRLTFSAYYADGGVSRSTIATARPSRDVAHLTHLFREWIEKIDPGFGVDVLSLSADSVEVLNAGQLALFSRSTQLCTPDGLDQLVDRLSNRLGARNVQRIVLRESHVPERSEARVPPLSAVSGPLPSPCKPLRPFRLFEKPEPIQVMAGVPEDPPRQFIWRRATHRVVRVEGPERIAPEWWQMKTGPHERTRDYYRVEDEQGRRFWLFREGLYRDAGKEPLSTWHVHGLFA